MNLMRDSDGESWVVLVYHEHEPSEVYGVFFSEKEAIRWAEHQTKGVAAWEVKMIIEEEN